jgi:molecular chaperone GrpE
LRRKGGKGVVDEELDEIMKDVMKDMIEEDVVDKNATDNQETIVDDSLEAEVEVEEEIEEEIENDDSDGVKEKKSFFKKKEKKDKKDEKIQELTDRLMRNMAEFDNFRKRSEREKAQMFEIGAKDIIDKILPIVDNFERGLATASSQEKESAFVQGIELIYKQLLSNLESVGVKVIEAVGTEFDPNFHNAVMHAEDEELGVNIVAEEFQKGYMYRDFVVRHSMVKVVN